MTIRHLFNNTLYTFAAWGRHNMLRIETALNLKNEIYKCSILYNFGLASIGQIFFIRDTHPPDFYVGFSNSWSKYAQDHKSERKA